jgi:hypothetical protein
MAGRYQDMPIAGIEEGIENGRRRAARQFGLESSNQSGLTTLVTTEARLHPNWGPDTISMITEVLTIANLGRESYGQPTLTAEEIRNTFRIIDVIFNGLTTR